MKFEANNIAGAQIRQMLRAVLAMWQGTPERADAIRVDGDRRDLAYDLMCLSDLPTINVKAVRKTGSSGYTDTDSEFKVLTDDKGNVVFSWSSPMSWSSDKADPKGVILRFHTGTKLGDFILVDGEPTRNRERIEITVLDVAIDMEDSWSSSSIEGENPVPAFLKVLLG